MYGFMYVQYVCMYAFIHACMYCIYIYIYIYIYTLYIYSIYLYIYTVYIYVYIHIYIYICACVCGEKGSRSDVNLVINLDIQLKKMGVRRCQCANEGQVGRGVGR
jgi:hypothetical protein